jgi:hypothetical protein
VNAATLRLALVHLIDDALGDALIHDIDICDDKPDTVTGPTVIVTWTASTRNREQWTHAYSLWICGFETTGTADRTHREDITRAVAVTIERSELCTWPTIDPAAEISIGGQAVQATAITTTITERPNL